MTALRRWAGGWAVALRIARRDVWRHKGRSLLVALAVALPVLVLTVQLVVLDTREPEPRDHIPERMGSSAAHVDMPSFLYLDGQDVSGYGATNTCAESCPPVTPIPGITKRTGQLQMAAPLAAYFHADRVIPFWTTVLTHSPATAPSRHLDVLRIDAADPAVRGMVDLASGRWPRAADEVVVTTAGLAVGLPSSGTVDLRTPYPLGAKPTRCRVVGVARSAAGTRYEAVMTATGLFASRSGDTDRAFLIRRDAPVTWDEVRAANARGLQVASRHVMEHPAEAHDAITLASSRWGEDGTLTLFFLVIILVCGLSTWPVFAVSAQRQRRVLAIAAANGAGPGHLRRVMLGQALLLAGIPATLGVAAGVAASRAVVDSLQRGEPTFDGFLSPQLMDFPYDIVGRTYDVPWQMLGAVVLTATLVAAATAMATCSGLTSLELKAVLRGRPAPRSAR